MHRSGSRRKSLIGGDDPEGEVGLIFAQMGLSGGVLDRSTFAVVAVVVMVTTFLAPPLLKALAPPVAGASTACEYEGIEDLTTAG
ncbi:MAG: hypothetical protein U0835_05605 [Isosphaeraceae bacterium]